MSDLRFSLIQYVGDPVRREAANVGVVVTGGASVAVVVDRAAHVRLAGAWPGFDRHLFIATVRDIKHVLADTHQLFLLERAIEFTGASGSTLEELSSSMANEFAMTSPRPYFAESPQSAARQLFDRMVRIGTSDDVRRDRHMTRGALRSMIVEVLNVWASSRAPGLVLETSVEVEGAITPHTVDLVAFDGKSLKMLFFAAPLEGAQAPLIRDSLPTVIDDLRRQHQDARFYAVLGERRSTGAASARRDPTLIARAVLARVEGLEILDLAQFRAEFASQAVVAL